MWEEKWVRECNSHSSRESVVTINVHSDKLEWFKAFAVGNAKTVKGMESTVKGSICDEK
jgi:hypothetical protein